MTALFGGHYTAFAKQNDEWYNFNDETFKKVNPSYIIKFDFPFLDERDTGWPIQEPNCELDISR